MTPISEEELKQQIALLEEEIGDLRTTHSRLRMQAIHEETKIIGVKLKLDALKEELKKVLAGR